MDPAQFTHVSLCAGYGGIDLGLRRVLPGLRTIAYSEIEEYACGLLAARMESGHLDPAPIWSDLKTFPFREFHGCVDILSGGYPCQPFSAAGKRRGTDDPRHLWPFIADGIRLCRPSLCFFENVEGHITLGLRDVLGDLERLGYAATWGIFSAAEVGAPHQRKRIFVLAHRCGAGLEGYSGHVHGAGWESAGQAGSTGEGDLPRVADAAGNDSECSAGAGPGSHKAGRAGTSGQCAGSDGDLWPARPGERQHAWEPPRVVANTFRNGRAKAERNAATMGGEERSEEGCKSEFGRVASSADGGSSVGDSHCRGQSSSLNAGRGSQTIVGGQDNLEPSERGQAQPSLGRDVNGPTSRLDYAKLCVSCDNRTDELRLLGNGVVPATAALAFRILLTQLDHDLR